MRIKVYLRIGITNRGYRIEATTKPNHAPIYSAYPTKKALPTASFALVLNVPDEKFREAERVVQEINLANEDVEVNCDVDREVLA